MYPREWLHHAENAAARYEGDPDLLISIAILESGWGESGNTTEYNNPFNIKTKDGSGWHKYPDMQAAFNGCAYLLYASRYYTDGRELLWRLRHIPMASAIWDVRAEEALYAIGRVYAPATDGNDPQQWARSIVRIYRQITSKGI